MSYGIEIQIPSDVIEAINEQAQQTPKLMATAYRRATSRLKSRWLTALRKEPPAASNFYKLPWASEKQRRAFFATKGFGHGIPYQRTDALAQGWDVDIDTADDGGAIVVSNSAPESIYVYGDLDTPRQPMFEKIPWLEPNDVNSEFLDEAEDVLIETYFTVADPLSGVPE